MEPFEFKWGNAEVKVLSVKQQGVEDLAFCAYLSRKHPLWHEGLLVCACSDILDARSIAIKFAREGVVLMEQVCYAPMPDYRRAVRVSDADVMITTPIIKAYGVFQALAEEIQRRLDRDGSNDGEQR